MVGRELPRVTKRRNPVTHWELAFWELGVRYSLETRPNG